MKKELKKFEEALEEVAATNGLSRRDALKIMGLGTVGAFGMGSSAQAEEGGSGSDKKATIVIVGGGAGGIMAMARLRRSAPNAKLILIAPNDIHLYQPGQVFMAAGLYTADEIKRPNADFIPSDVEWIKESVAEFDPDNNQVITDKNKKIKYDFLVVATGLAYDYERIEGMRKELVGQKGISSVYLNDPVTGDVSGGSKTWEWFRQLRAAAEKASPNNPIQAIYTQPDTPIKCGGAPQKILYLSDDYVWQHRR